MPHGLSWKTRDADRRMRVIEARVVWWLEERPAIIQICHYHGRRPDATPLGLEFIAEPWPHGRAWRPNHGLWDATPVGLEFIAGCSIPRVGSNGPSPGCATLPGWDNEMEIPTGFRPIAQGCAARATLGRRIPHAFNPTGVASGKCSGISRETSGVIRTHDPDVC
jgi:hypothetical protein